MIVDIHIFFTIEFLYILIKHIIASMYKEVSVICIHDV
jgi:hypothetical protein